MPIFKLFKDECYETWQRYHYEVKADSIEEATNLVYADEVEPYDSECLPDLMQAPLNVEIYDESGDLLFEK